LFLLLPLLWQQVFRHVLGREIEVDFGVNGLQGVFVEVLGGGDAVFFRGTGEEGHLANCGLMAHRDMELCFGFDVAHEVGYTAYDRNRQVTRFDGTWLGNDASFNSRRVQLRNTHASSVALLDYLNGLPKHLHRLDFLVLLQGGELDDITDLCFSSQASASQHGALTFNLEAVIDSKQEILVGSLLSVRNLNLLQDSLDEVLNANRASTLALHFRGSVRSNRDDLGLGAELCRANLLRQPGELYFVLLVIALNNVDLVEGNDELVHQDLPENDALRSLSLDQLLAVDDQDHEIDDGGSPNDRLHQACVARTINQRELDKFNAV